MNPWWPWVMMLAANAVAEGLLFWTAVP